MLTEPQLRELPSAFDYVHIHRSGLAGVITSASLASPQVGIQSMRKRTPKLAYGHAIHIRGNSLGEPRSLTPAAVSRIPVKC
jgi:hypothetical protein